MIPASYMFKDVFQQSFYDPDVAEAVQRQRQARPGHHIFSWWRHRHPENAGARRGEHLPNTSSHV